MITVNYNLDNRYIIDLIKTLTSNNILSAVLFRADTNITDIKTNTTKYSFRFTCKE